MTRLSDILLLGVLLVTSGWLFRKLSMSRAVMFVFRILAILGTITGAIVWTISALGVWRARNSFGDWGDNAVTHSTNLTWPWILLFWITYACPMIAFLLVLFSAFGFLKGSIRRVAYWVALVLLVVTAAFFWWVYSKFHSSPWWQIGFTYAGFAIFWGYAFRKNGSHNLEGSVNSQ